jgi:hypothetical protein
VVIGAFDIHDGKVRYPFPRSDAQRDVCAHV